MAVAVAAVIAVIGCEPRVTVEPPKEPITINVNVKIDHQIRVKVDSELEDLFAKKPELF